MSEVALVLFDPGNRRHCKPSLLKHGLCWPPFQWLPSVDCWAGSCGRPPQGQLVILHLLHSIYRWRPWGSGLCSSCFWRENRKYVALMTPWTTHLSFVSAGDLISSFALLSSECFCLSPEKLPVRKPQRNWPLETMVLFRDHSPGLSPKREGGERLGRGSRRGREEEGKRRKGGRKEKGMWGKKNKN